jgi:two-component system, NarL family, sensor kinase
MDVKRHLKELSTLNHILEILNQESEFSKALQLALEELVKLLDLSTGWVFLQKEDFELAAFTGLPPALSKNKSLCLREGGCTCQGRFERGELDTGVNIVDCSRLEKTKGNKGGLEVHASMPLLTHEGPVGILNLAAPGRTIFDDETLAFLTVVGRALGLAFRRATLQEQQLREREAMVKLEERTRLARDIQHSVTQLLQAAGSSLQTAKENKVQREVALEQSSSFVTSSLSGLEKLDALLSSSDAIKQLTPKEQEVLKGIAKGLSNKQIAKELSIAEKTVKVHVSSVLGKLELKGRTQAALWAKARGL